MRRLLWLPLVLGAVPVDDLRPGLVGEYFNVGRELREFPKIPSSKRPFLRRVDAKLEFEETRRDFAECGVADYFCVRWTGVIRIPEDGTYTFYSKSDDGSAVWIGDRQVADNGGLHDFKVEKSGKADLKRGDHKIRVEFMENDDAAALVVSWQKPGGEKEVLPASVLWHERDPALDKE